MKLMILIPLIAVLHFCLHYIAFRLNWNSVIKILQQPIDNLVPQLPISSEGELLFLLLQGGNSLIWGAVLGSVLSFAARL